MPRPSNIEAIFDELLYEPKVLKEANWNVHRGKDSIIVRSHITHEKYGKIAYIFRAYGPDSTWLRVSQYYPKKSIKDREILNVPLSWLPEGYREEFQLILVQCMFEAPEDVSESVDPNIIEAEIVKPEEIQ